MKRLAYIVIGLSALLSACKKGPGEGGKSKITGTVWVENYNSLNNPTDVYVLKNEYAGADKDVYLVFGDDISYGLKTKAGPTGQFEFDYLRAGKYTVYVQSKDTTRTSVSGIKTVSKEIDLGKKETQDTQKMIIYN
ncbi:MAG: hypothetical protein ACJ77K_15665 [Bacteroidia bacterium]